MVAPASPRRRSIFIKLAIALAAPVVFLVITETLLAICGVRVPTYVGLPPGVADYWIPCEPPTQPPGFNRAFPRNYKIFPETLPLFVKDKPANGFRVFCLGESSVAGLPYERGCFSDWLRLRLGAMLTDKSVEVVNAGNAGWYASEIRRLLQECLQYKPDLIVWMVGHNESVPENVLKIRKELRSPILNKIQIFVRGLRTTHFLSRWIPKLVPAQRENLHDRKAADEIRCFDDAELKILQKNFREATAGALSDAKKAGVPIVICTMPKNWRECPPSSSYYSDNIYKTDSLRARWKNSYEAGCALLDKSDFANAILQFNDALAIDPTPAKLQFVLARALEASGQIERAKECYLNALVRDACPMRALPWIEETIRDVAARESAPLADLEMIFNENGKNGVAGFEFIADNVHPNLIGHEVITNELLRIFEEKLKLQFDRSKDVGPVAGRARLGIDKLDKMVFEKSECHSNLGLVLASGNVDDLWKKTYNLAKSVLSVNANDWEVTAWLGLLETMNGEAALGKQLIERAMSKDSYVLLSFVYFYRNEPPYTRVLDKAKIDIDGFEKQFTPGMRVQYENRVSRARNR